MDWSSVVPALAIGSAVVCTSFISGVFGMAGGVILLALLLGAGMEVAAAMALHGIAQASGNLWRAFLWRSRINWRVLIWFLIGAVAAFGLFALVRFVPDRPYVLILLGIVPFLTLALPERIVPQADRPAGAAAGGLSTMGITLLAGVAGPLLDAFFVRLGWDRRDVVATKAGCQFIGNSLKTVYFSLAASTVWQPDLDLAAAAIAASIIGTTASRFALERMSDYNFRRWTQIIIMIVGASSIMMGAGELLSRP
jgi:uncharacterized membrane protein YfcA